MRQLVVLLIVVQAAAVWAGSIEVANGSFEMPAIDPIENPFMAVPYTPFWSETDVDTDPFYGGRNTGIFLNTEPNSPAGDHIVNAHGRQLAFLGGQTGNAFFQELTATYQAGKRYVLKVDICPSLRHPPKTTAPMDTLVLSLNAPKSADPNDLAIRVVRADEIIANELRTFSVILPPVQSEDYWAGQTIGIAIRAVGTFNPGFIGPFWDLDKVHLIEYSRVPDFTGEGVVDLDDFSILAGQWLSCEAVTADVTGDGCVTLEDLEIFLDYWLENV